MFKSTLWRADKNKIKAVFKLHFHATQVSHLDGHSLMISVVPADIGKPTVRLEKVTVQDGSCFWEKPVYETVKFVLNPKTGKINERFYHFVVAAGSAKVGIVGDVLVDFANYAVATELSTISLPLKNTKSEAILHVSIQRMQDSVDQREVDEMENTKLNSQDRSLRAQFSSGHTITDGSIKSNSTEVFIHLANIKDGPFNKTISNVTELKENGRASSGSDVTLSSLEPSTDDSLSSPREALSRETSQEDSNNVIDLLARRAEMSELELQTLRKQISKESKRGQDLSRELISLKEERDELKDQCKKLNSSLKHVNEEKLKNTSQFKNPWGILQELKEEINYQKDLNSNLRLQLQKTQEANSELILAVRDLDEMLDGKKSKEMLIIPSNPVMRENAEVSRETNTKCETDDDEEQERALEEIVKGQDDGNEAYLLERKIVDLYSEMETYRKERDEMETQMEQLALDYEILKQENHDISNKLEQCQLQEQLNMQYDCSNPYETLDELETQIESLENELEKRTKEFADSLVTINELENHVKSLEEELENQAEGFEADLEALTNAKVEQEQRVIRAEETLKNVRLQNGSMAERLQEEFRKLSLQMASTFEANEKVAVKAIAEANELRLEKCRLEEMLEKADEDLKSVRDFYEAKLIEVSNEIEMMESEITDKSMEIERQRKLAEETTALLSQEILMHKSEVERLTKDNNTLSEKAEEIENLRAELAQMKGLVKQTERLVERGITERNDLENIVDLVKMEEDKLLKELNAMRALKDENESMIHKLKSEVETLKVECKDFRHSSFEGELEREKLSKQVSQLKGDLKKKEEAIIIIEKKLKDSNGRATVSDGTKVISKTNKTTPAPRVSKEVAILKEKIKLLESRIKLKETALETSAISFLAKENDLQSKIEDLERRSEALTQNSVSRHTKDPKGYGFSASPINSNNDILYETETKASAMNTRNQGDDVELLSKMELLKKRNETKERELKEMQERYSEISLKFAEVEGERQQLVMTLRNIMSTMRS